MMEQWAIKYRMRHKDLLYWSHLRCPRRGKCHGRLLGIHIYSRCYRFFSPVDLDHDDPGA
jgi:hypothetical protein